MGELLVSVCLSFTRNQLTEPLLDLFVAYELVICVKGELGILAATPGLTGTWLAIQTVIVGRLADPDNP